MIVQIALAIVLISGGLFFIFVSGLGVIHSIGKSETLGSMLILMGLAVFNGLDINSFKLLVILLFIFLVNPTATHILARTAHRCGLQPWTLRQQRSDNNTKRGK